jgi:hypothetical protein
MQDAQTNPGTPVERADGLEWTIEVRRGRFSPLAFLFGFGIGAFVGVALALLAVALVELEQEPSVVQSDPGPLPDVAPVTVETPEPTPDIRPRTRTALDVRLGPGNGYAVVGLLPKDEPVEVVGRDNDSQWLAIRFPSGSTGRGWIPVASVDFPPDLSSLAVALPTPLPRSNPSVPPSLGSGRGGALLEAPPASAPAAAVDGPEGGLSVAPTTTPDAARPTSTPAPGLPDLVVTRVRLLSDRHVAVTVANRGDGDLVGYTVFVQVRDLGSRSEMVITPIPRLRVGETLTVETASFEVAGEQTIVAMVDPFGSVPELDRTNNTLQVVLAVPLPATQTPG